MSLLLSGALSLPAPAATASLLGSASATAFNSGVPDLGLSGYLVNLGLILAVVGVLAYLAARFGKGKLPLPVGLRGRDLKVEDRLPIDPQRSLLVVSYGQRRWLVGMTQYAINPLAELDPAPDFEQTLGREVRS